MGVKQSTNNKLWCCHSTCATDKAPTNEGGAYRNPSPRTRASAIRDCITMITIQIILPCKLWLYFRGPPGNPHVHRWNSWVKLSLIGRRSDHITDSTGRKLQPRNLKFELTTCTSESTISTEGRSVRDQSIVTGLAHSLYHSCTGTYAVCCCTPPLL